MINLKKYCKKSITQLTFKKKREKFFFFQRFLISKTQQKQKLSGIFSKAQSIRTIPNLSPIDLQTLNPQRRHRGHPRLSIVVTSPFCFTIVLKQIVKHSETIVPRWGKILASGPSCTRVIRRRGRKSRGLIAPLFSLFLLRDENRLRRAALCDSEWQPCDHFAFIFFSLSLSLSFFLSHPSSILFHAAFASLPLRIKFNTPVSWLIIFLHEILRRLRC